MEVVERADVWVIEGREDFGLSFEAGEALGVEGPRGGEQMVVIVDTDTDTHMGLLVDELIGQRQVVLKSIEANYRGVPGISGATILSDGRAALILDVPALQLLAAPGRRGAKMEYVQ